MLNRLNKIVADQASIISNEINKHIVHRLRDFSTIDECSQWFMSPDGQQVMDRCIFLGLGLEPKRPRRKMAYSFFSKDKKPANLITGRAMWKLLTDEEKQVYEKQADDEYQETMRRFTDAYDVEPDETAQKKIKAAEKRAATKLRKAQEAREAAARSQPPPPLELEDELTNVADDI
jgi:hypothetical protein